MANWWKGLSRINKKTPIIAIAVEENKFDWDAETGKVLKNKKIFTKQFNRAKKLLDYDFDAGYGGSNGPRFTAWTKDKVYFPGVYDGSEWIESVPRNPINEPKTHVGGE